MVKKLNIAVIPARGGSKRIPEKNIVDFHGKPMIVWTIEAAQKTKLFDRIIVSTDDLAIASVAEKSGVEVPFLRNKHNDDFSSVSEATIVAVKQAEVFFDEKYENVIQLMANCPLRKAEHILRAYQNFVDQRNLSQISCFKFGWMNPWWAVTLDKAMKPTQLFKETLSKRSQDLDDLYCPTGAIWIAKSEELIKMGSFYGENYKMCPMPWMSAVDIDDYDDLKMAEMLFDMR